jgi:hypothetical protein
VWSGNGKIYFFKGEWRRLEIGVRLKPFWLKFQLSYFVRFPSPAQPEKCCL